MTKIKTSTRMARVVAICGMAMMWTCIHNQLMYPVTFTYIKPDAPSVYLLYLIYFCFALFTNILIIIGHERIATRMLQNRIAMVVIGCAGGMGAAALIFNDFSHAADTALAAVGLAAFAFYASMHFAFWTVQLTNGSRANTALDAILSFLLFCLFTAARVGLGVHASWFTIAFPFMCAALAWVALAQPQRAFTSNASSLRQLPLDVLSAAVGLTLLVGVLVAVFNPSESLFTYPRNRALLYLINLVLFALIGVIYWRMGKSARRSSTVSFSLVALYSIAAVFFTALTLNSAMFNIGNYALVAAKIALSTYIWLLLVVYARTKHLNAALPVALYLIVAIQIPNALTVIMHYTNSTVADPLASSFASLLFGSAFGISLLLNIVLLALFVRLSKDINANTKTVARHDESLAEGIARFTKTYGLSAREAEILQLTYEHSSAKKVAELSHIAESTVYTHVRNIYRKTDVHSRQQLVDLIDQLRAD